MGPLHLALDGAINILGPRVMRTNNQKGKLVKIVIIADLHGNYEALRALPEVYDELWALGDLVNYGPEPAAVVDFVKAKSTAAVRGNHDHSIGYDVDPHCTFRYEKMAETTRRFTASVLNDGEKEFLRQLPLQVELRRQNTSFYLCHAKPSDPLYGYCSEDSKDWVSEVERVHRDVLLVGHTHIPFIRRIGDHLVVNPGSLGQPKTGKPDACYAVWEDGSFQLKSYPYPVDKTVEKLKALSFPRDVEQDLITELRTGSVS
jgi:putative phosphoesterase